MLLHILGVLVLLFKCRMTWNLLARHIDANSSDKEKYDCVQEVAEKFVMKRFCLSTTIYFQYYNWRSHYISDILVSFQLWLNWNVLCLLESLIENTHGSKANKIVIRTNVSYKYFTLAAQLWNVITVSSAKYVFDNIE